MCIFAVVVACICLAVGPAVVGAGKPTVTLAMIAVALCNAVGQIVVIKQGSVQAHLVAHLAVQITGGAVVQVRVGQPVRQRHADAQRQLLVITRNRVGIFAVGIHQRPTDAVPGIAVTRTEAALIPAIIPVILLIAGERQRAPFAPHQVLGQVDLQSAAFVTQGIEEIPIIVRPIIHRFAKGVEPRGRIAIARQRHR
ncbi:Uncharacterised protein [Serratia quinivorans]|nr:Uncharacterised protein [Serratia quinivorans]